MADIVFPGKAVGGVLGRDFLPSNFDIELYKGDFFPLTITLVQPAVSGNTKPPLNLTGYTAQAQIRTNFGGEAIYAFTVTIPDPTSGKVNLVLPSSVSAGIAAGSYVWDFQIKEPSGNVRTYLAGDVTIYNEVTVA